jgi:hypothetical protein
MIPGPRRLWGQAGPGQLGWDGWGGQASFAAEAFGSVILVTGPLCGQTDEGSVEDIPHQGFGSGGST